MVFIDDILIYSPTWHSHLEHLRLVFAALRDHKFYLKERNVSLVKRS
jgi:hypothetical protein